MENKTTTPEVCRYYGNICELVHAKYRRIHNDEPEVSFLVKIVKDNHCTDMGQAPNCPHYRLLKRVETMEKINRKLYDCIERTQDIISETLKETTN